MKPLDFDLVLCFAVFLPPGNECERILRNVKFDIIGTMIHYRPLSFSALVSGLELG